MLMLRWEFCTRLKVSFACKNSICISHNKLLSGKCITIGALKCVSLHMFNCKKKLQRITQIAKNNKGFLYGTSIS